MAGTFTLTGIVKDASDDPLPGLIGKASFASQSVVRSVAQGIVYVSPVTVTTDETGAIKDGDGETLELVTETGLAYTITWATRVPGITFMAPAAGTTLDFADIVPVVPSIVGPVDATQFDGRINALEAAIPPAVADVTGLQAALDGKARKSANFVNVKDFGAVGDGVANDLAAVTAAINSLPTSGIGSGGVVYFPSGRYLCPGTLPLLPRVCFVGDGRYASELRGTSGTLFAPENTVVRDMVIEKMTMSTMNGHIIDLGTTSSFTNSSIRDAAFVTYGNDSSILRIRWRDCLGNLWHNVHFVSPKDRTVPMWDSVTPTGGTNHNHFDTVTVYGNGNNTVPAWYIDAQNSSCAFDNSWKNIIGQMNCGGLIEAYSVCGLSLEDIQDWDADVTGSGPYTRDLIKIGTSSVGGLPSRRIRALNIGTRGGTLSAGVYHLNISGAQETPIVAHVGDYLGPGAINAAFKNNISDPHGYQSNVTFMSSSSTMNTGGSYIYNGTDLIATLPAATTQAVGRVITVKNINATPLTVRAVGDAVFDGRTSLKLAQYEARTFITDAGAWYMMDNSGGTGIAPTVETITATGGGTWTKPTAATRFRVILQGGGGGGGGGRRGAAGSNRYGGGGGGGGKWTEVWLNPADLPSSVTYTVGAGGGGGSAASADDANGGSGTAGGDTKFNASAWLARGGGPGSGGTNAAGTGGSSTPGTNNGGSGATGTGSSGQNTQSLAAYGGGAGGGIPTGNTAGNGGPSFLRPEANGYDWVYGGTGGAAGADGNVSSQTVPTSPLLPGSGGSGGGASTSGADAGGNGGNGVRGGGGGGGGASTNGANSGAGGAGGDGFIQITSYFS